MAVDLRPSDRTWFKRCRRSWDFSSRLRRNLEPVECRRSLRRHQLAVADFRDRESTARGACPRARHDGVDQDGPHEAPVGHARAAGLAARRHDVRRSDENFQPGASRISRHRPQFRGQNCGWRHRRRDAIWSAQLFNNRIDAGVTRTFLVLVAIVVLANARIWWQLLSGKRTAQLHEEPYVPVAERPRRLEVRSAGESAGGSAIWRELPGFLHFAAHGGKVGFEVVP